MNENLAGFQKINVDTGEILFREGDSGDKAFLIMKGRIKIYQQIRRKRIVIARLGPGEIIGEMAIITRDARTATAEAMEPSELCVITEEALQETLGRNLAIVKTLIDQLIGRLKRLLLKQPNAVLNLDRIGELEESFKKIKEQADQYARTHAQVDKDVTRLLDVIDEGWQKNGPWL